jgi:hypothetical protein
MGNKTEFHNGLKSQELKKKHMEGKGLGETEHKPSNSPAAQSQRGSTEHKSPRKL